MDPIPQAANVLPRLPIEEEESMVLQISSMIPLIGMIFSKIQESSIQRKLDRELDSSGRMMNLILLKNWYKELNIISNIFTIAILVHGFALGIFEAPLVIVFSLLFCIKIGREIYCMKKNQQVFHDVHVNGIRRGLQFY